MNILIVILMLSPCFPEDKTTSRNIGQNHEIVWKQGGFTVFRYELAAGDRSSPQVHDQPVLTIPLMGDRMLDHNSTAKPLTWAMRTGMVVHPTPRSHSVFNPTPRELINIEIEFPLSEEIILTPRFSQGLKEQYFKFPRFVLGRHVLQRGQVLHAAPECDGPVIAMSDMTLREATSNSLLRLKTGDAVNTVNDLENVSGYPVGVLTLCTKAQKELLHFGSQTRIKFGDIELKKP